MPSTAVLTYPSSGHMAQLHTFMARISLMFLTICAFAPLPCFACERNTTNILDYTAAELHPTEVVQVFFMRAPLEKDKFGYNTVDLGLFHASLGFRLQNGSSWTLEYDAVSFNTALIPAIVNDTLHWDVGTELCLQPDLDSIPSRMLYWTVSYPVSQINGTQYNEFMNWARTYAQTGTLYQLMNLFDGESDPPQMLRQASTCGDWVWGALSFLRDSLGAELRPMVPPTTTSISLFQHPSKEPVLVDATVTQEVLEFYKDLSQAMSDISKKSLSLRDLLKLVHQMKERVFYVYAPSRASSTQYLKVWLRPTKSPFAILDYAPPSLFAAQVRTYPSLDITSDTWAGNVST